MRTSKMAGNGQNSNASGEVFDFFGLPRELRDAIYEVDSLTERQTAPLSVNERKGAHIVNHKPLTNLLLVSRTFKLEYATRLERLRRVTLEDHALMENGTLKLESAACETPGLELGLVIRTHDSNESTESEPGLTPARQVHLEVEFHMGWISDLIKRMNKLSTIRIVLLLHPSSVVKAYFEALMSELSTLTEIDKVEDGHVGLCEGLDGRFGTGGRWV